MHGRANMWREPHGCVQHARKPLSGTTPLQNSCTVGTPSVGPPHPFGRVTGGDAHRNFLVVQAKMQLVTCVHVGIGEAHIISDLAGKRRARRPNEREEHSCYLLSDGTTAAARRSPLHPKGADVCLGG